jgi:hypothetical protein
MNEQKEQVQTDFQKIEKQIYWNRVLTRAFCRCPSIPSPFVRLNDDLNRHNC